MKRSIILILCAILLLPALPSGADGTVITAHPGDEIDVSLTFLENTGGAVIATLELVYDHSALELISGQDFSRDKKAGLPLEYFTSGMSLTARFRIADSAVPGEYPIRLETRQALGKDGNDAPAPVFDTPVILVPYPDISYSVFYLDSADGSLLKTETLTLAPDTEHEIGASVIDGYQILDGLTGSVTVRVSPDGTAVPSSVTFWLREYIHQSPSVTVRYLLRGSGSELRAADQVVCPLNETTLISAPEISGYIVAGDENASVSVDAYGNPDRTAVDFWYSAFSAPTVQVRYLEQGNGKELRTPDQVICPLNETTEISAPEISFYTLDGEKTVSVSVNASGKANRTSVDFYYSAIPAPAVPVRYLVRGSGSELRAADQVTCPLNETTFISAPEISGCTLIGDRTVSVSVDAYGNADKTEVDFWYVAIPAPTVQVRYMMRGSGNELRAPDTVTCPLNETTEIVAPVISGYTVAGQQTVSVRVDSHGNADKAAVDFYYRAIPVLHAGDIVTFGAYPQTASGFNTPIEWLVLECDAANNRALLISRCGLDCKPYNTSNVSVTWARCSLRSWLNEEFINRAFDPEEQSAILTTALYNTDDQGYSGWDTDGGNNSEDRIFLLSYAEANRYFGIATDDINNRDSRLAPTAYAKKNGAFASGAYKTSDGAEAGWWWLRSPGVQGNQAAVVGMAGSLGCYIVNDNDGSVRPAFWLDLGSEIF